MEFVADFVFDFEEIRDVPQDADGSVGLRQFQTFVGDLHDELLALVFERDDDIALGRHLEEFRVDDDV